MENVSLEMAQTMILDRVQRITETEYVHVQEISGRILAQDMVSAIDNPPFDRSPIDGYACKASDVENAAKENPVLLQVLEEIDAGQYSCVKVEHGQAVRIMTGAAIPDGCDCCIRQEDTDYGETKVAVYKGVSAWKNYCYCGEDYKKDTLMAEKNTRLSYVEAGILASMGCAEVPVYRLPRLALLTTGDEVVEPGSPLPPGKIYNSNLTMLWVRMQEIGINPVIVKSVADDPELMAEALKEAAEKADIIVTTGGVSVGKKDIMHDAIPILGAEKVFWRALLKPGSPTLFSVYKNVPIISLSGNPFGALANFELLLRPALAKMTGNAVLELRSAEKVMADDFTKASKVRRFVRAIHKDGKIYLPKGLHSSGVISSMKNCNCMVDIPAGTEGLKAGDKVKVLLI